MGVPKIPVTLVGNAGGFTGFSDGDHPLNNGFHTSVPGAATTRPGDLLVMTHYAASGAAGRSIAAIAGWNLLFDDPDAGADGGYLAAWWKIANAADSGTVSIPGTGFDGGSTSGDTTWCSSWAFRGAKPVSPITNLGTFGSPVRTGSSTACVIPGINCSAYNYVMLFGGKDNQMTWTALTNQQGLTWTGFVDTNAAGGNGSVGVFVAPIPAGGVNLSTISIATNGAATAYKGRMFEIARNVNRSNPIVAIA